MNNHSKEGNENGEHPTLSPRQSFKHFCLFVIGITVFWTISIMRRENYSEPYTLLSQNDTISIRSKENQFKMKKSVIEFALNKSVEDTPIIVTTREEALAQEIKQVNVEKELISSKLKAMEREIEVIRNEKIKIEIKLKDAEEMLSICKNKTANEKHTERAKKFDKNVPTFIYPHKDGGYNDMGGVPSICKTWDDLDHQGTEIDGIMFKNSNWMCEPGQVGNKLGLYFQARSFALLHKVEFHIEPACSKDNDNLISWLPQNVWYQNYTDVFFTNRTSDSLMTVRNLMCQCVAPIAHQCVELWPKLSTIWRSEIRHALQKWASSVQKPKIDKGVATIHLRCGDIINPEVVQNGAAEHMGFLKSSLYLKYLSKREIKAIHILTTPLDGCKRATFERQRDCKWAPQCRKIVGTLIKKLSSSLNLLEEQIRIYDHESIMWSMHHIVFSEISFCSPSTFCLFPSLGSNHVIHSSGAGNLIPSVTKTLPDVLGESFETDRGDYLIKMSDLPKNETVKKIIEFIGT